MPDTQKPDFIIFPAVDLRRGRVVRLSEGDPNRQCDYDADPAAAARRWLDCGARWLHVVNLDGAFGEESALNRQALERILRAAGEYQACVQYGGGLRTLEAVDNLLAMGVGRAVLGTLAAEQPAQAGEAVARWGAERIAAGIDGREGWVSVRGWREGAGIQARDLARRLKQEGLEWLIVTDIARDGLQAGVNLEAILEINHGLHGTHGKKVNHKEPINQSLIANAPINQLPITNAPVHPMPLRLVASGGVRGREDILAARDAGLAGIIVGRALYEGKLDLKQILKEV